MKKNENDTYPLRKRKSTWNLADRINDLSFDLNKLRENEIKIEKSKSRKIEIRV